MTPDGMLAVLMRARRALPLLLQESDDTWHSMHITYEYPHVRRLWRQFDVDHRVYLHAIEPLPYGGLQQHSMSPYFHAHPWPSAVMIISGRHKMRLSRAGEMILYAGSSYVMDDPDDRHSVEPIDEHDVLSIMVTGRPYAHLNPSVPRPPPQPPMLARDRLLLAANFRLQLDLNPDIGLVWT